MFNFSPKKEIFGLDLSDFSLKIIKLKKKKDKFSLVSFGETKVPPGIIEQGIIKKENKLIEIIKSARTKIKGEKLKTKYAICSLPEEEAFIKAIRLPKIDSEEIKKVIKWQIEPNIPVKLEKIYYDWELIKSKNKKRTDVSVVVIPKKIADSYLKVFKESGIQPLAFEIESMAAARCLISQFRAHPILLLDFGAAGCGLTIFSGKTILFTSHIPISGQDLDLAIAKELNLTQSKAESLKKKFGLKNKRIHKAIFPILEDLSKRIKEYIDYYRSYYEEIDFLPDGIMSKIILCGGSANLIGLIEFFNSSLKIPVQLGNPLNNIFIPKKIQFSQKKSLSYTTAIGLVLRKHA